VALAVLSGVQTQAETCKHYRLAAGQLTRWRKDLEPNAHLAFGGGEQDDLKERIAEPERMAGRPTMQVDILEKASTRLDAPRGSEGRW